MSIHTNKTKHSEVPKNYTFMLKDNVNSTSNCFSYELMVFDNINSVYNNSENTVALLQSGEYEFDKIKVWVFNQEKQGFIYYYFESKEQFNELNLIIKQKNSDKLKKIINPVYRYSARSGWVLTEQYQTKDTKNIFGYDDYIEQISKDITNHITYNSFLQQIGEVRGINYLLYGPPGTGKTSLIKAVASKLSCSVFIVNAGEVTTTNVLSILSPKTSYSQDTNKTKLLLFEDFDRFLSFDKVDTVISAILNALDGFDDKGDTIRFFTANNHNLIMNHDALINRISCKFEFHYPTLDIFKCKLKQLLSFYDNDNIVFDENKINNLIEMVYNKKITVRPFVNFVIRYLFDDNCIDKMIENIDQLT